MLEMKSIRLKTDSGEFPMTFAHNGYQWEDVTVRLQDGKIFVTGGATPVLTIELIFSNPYFRDAMVLGDAFERGYGEFIWQRPDFSRFLPWYFLASENGCNYGFGVKTQPNAVCFWRCDAERIALTLDIRNGCNGLVLAGRCLEACEVVTMTMEGDAFDALTAFCHRMCDNPRLAGRPIYGGNDWYCNYGDSSAEKILRHTRRVVECAPGGAPAPYMVVDAGWQLCAQSTEPCIGPWNSGNSLFGDMGKLARQIRELGAIPGIWIRPLLTLEKVPQDWALKRNGTGAYLDPSHPAVLDKVREDISRLREWGYGLIKHDFTTVDIFGAWGFQMKDGYGADVEFTDKTLTTAQIVKNLYRAIREAAGEDVVIIGCNTIGHLCAGIFEIQRTGDDTSGVDWERVKTYGVNTLAFRSAQHNAFYAADADCVGITRQLNWDDDRKWLDVLAKSGTPLFVSIGDDAYTPQIRQDITEAFRKTVSNEKISRPLDWMQTKVPQMWESAFGVDRYAW